MSFKKKKKTQKKPLKNREVREDSTDLSVLVLVLAGAKSPYYSILGSGQNNWSLITP